MKCVLCEKPAARIFYVGIRTEPSGDSRIDDEDGWDMCDEHAQDAMDSVLDIADNTFNQA